MFENFKKFVINNGRALIFVLLIVFVIFSFNSKQEEDYKSVIDLLTYLDKSFSSIDNTFKNLSNQTLVLQNNEANYDLVIDSLLNLSKQINDYKFKLPNDTGEDVYQEVRISLIQVYQISQDKADLFGVIYQSRKSLVSGAEDYYRFNNLDTISTADELNSSVNAWKKVIDYKTNEIKKYENEKTKSYYEDQLKIEEEAFQKVVNYNKLNPEIINSELKNNIKNAVSQVQFLKYNGFLRLQIEDVETPSFGEKLKKLQDSVQKLKNAKNIKSSQVDNNQKTS